MKKIIVEIKDDWKPEDGEAFDAVLDALNHFDIPCYTYETHEDGDEYSFLAVMQANEEN